LNEIANGGRVSNPVPGNAGPKAGIVPKETVARCAWRAEGWLVAAVPEFVLELSLNAM